MTEEKVWQEKLGLSEQKRYDELVFTDNFLFCKIMERNPCLCRDLLEIILGVEYMTLMMEFRERYNEGFLCGRSAGQEIGRKEGIKQGIEQGIERGIEQEKEELALRMVREGELSAEKIALYTGLSLKKIKEFQEML